MPQGYDSSGSVCRSRDDATEVAHPPAPASLETSPSLLYVDHHSAMDGETEYNI